MPWWLVAIEAFALLLVFALVLIALIGIRRRVLAQGGTTFDMCIAMNNQWHLGIGRYRQDTLEFFRAFSFSPRPMRTFERGTVTVLENRAPTSSEAYAIHGGFVVLEVHTNNDVSNLALHPEAVTGLLAWLESMPPGNIRWQG